MATRLASQPFIDGDDGLFAAAEGSRAVEATVGTTVVFGIGLAALVDGVLVALTSDARPVGERVSVRLAFVDTAGERTEQVEVRTYPLEAEVNAERTNLVARVDQGLRTGEAISRRLGEVFPRLLLGDRARQQIDGLTGNEKVFSQLIRHLRALDAGASRWVDGEVFEPVAVSFSVESQATLGDGSLGPLRDFPTPEGFGVERWSLHTKLTGGNGARLYFRPVRRDGRAVVLVGYFGDHLPTVTHRT